METKRNLEQRLLAVRAAIPRLTPKKYSDGVKYKFNKISDVYEYLNPALEANGVLLHITGEHATRRYDDGSPMFWQPYAMQTSGGYKRTLWIYEADITLEWANADDPADKRGITIHALGTNDGGPDKAKGSAWTYAMKFFLFEELGVDQGEDDPDNRVEAPAPQPQQEQPRQRAARPAAGPAQAPQRAQTVPAQQQPSAAATAPAEGTIPGGPAPEDRQKYNEALLACQRILQGITNPATANEAMKIWHTVQHSGGSDKVANTAWVKRMRELGLTWDAEAGAYVGKAEVA